MGLYVEFDISDYGYMNEVQGNIADLLPFYEVMDFAPACEAFVKTFIEEAQRLVPVDTGYLRSTINATTDGFHCSAEATAEYAEYVEYGTFRMREQPYFTPALEKAMGVFTKIADDIVNQTKEKIMEQVMIQAEDMLATVEDIFLMFFLMLIIIFIVEIISEFFRNIFGDDDKDTPMPTITII